MNEFIKRHGAFISFLVAAAISAVLILSVAFLADMPKTAPLSESYTEYNGGKPAAAVRLGDFEGLSAVAYANYTEGEYVVPHFASLPQGELVELTSHAPAPGKGTYQFVLANIDADSGTAFADFTAAKEKYAGYDGNLHVTVYIPTVFAASAIYLDEELVAKAGALSDYTFVTYNENYTGKTEQHKNGTQGVYIDVSFYGRSIQGIGYGTMAGHMITIHFESDGKMLSGVRGTPYIGTAAEVRGFMQTNVYLATAGAVLAAIILGTFALLCFIKRTLSFLPQLGVLAGVLLTCVSRMFLWGSTAAPYLLSAAGMLGLSFIIFAPSIMIRLKIKKFPVWILVAAVGAINIIIHITMAFLTPGAFAALHIYRLVISIFLAAVVLAVTGYSSFRRQCDVLAPVLPVLAASVTIVIPFLPLYSLTAYTQPVIYMFFAILLFTILVFLREFALSERTSMYLTRNLQSEAERRTQDLSRIIGERDRILRYLSHDLRKPVISVKRFIGELQSSETDEVRLKTFSTALSKIEQVDKSLVELQKYSRLNFSEEQPAKTDLAEVLSAIYEALAPDCEANNVHLHVAEATNYAFCRKETLVAVLNNLIFNALEHAECANIYLSTARSRKECSITVADDGKGIAEGVDLFAPYVTENRLGDNLGLGLYICRGLMHDMGGELFYERAEDRTVFKVTLPLA